MGQNEFDFCILITTHNRPNMLSELIDQIKIQKNDYKIKIIVIDDGSNEIYNLPTDIKYIKYYPNMGKKRFWKVIDSSFKYIKNIKSKYYLYLQDDVKIIDNFFNGLVNKYENIDDENKICLSFLTDHRVNSSNWTNYTPIERGEVIKTQWVELHFICEKKFFECLNYSIEPIPLTRWDGNPNLSSGVGWQLSVRLHNLGKSMYHSKNTFVTHGNHESQMNKLERKKNKLIVT
jgi:glycosyltransferase involved in cell wall biosynthesis